MGIEATLTLLNEMRSAGLLAEYAIGGAVAAFLYIEPGATFDLDVFTAWKPAEGEGGLLTLQPLYAYLAKRGYNEYQKEAVVIEGWAVQFLPPSTPLIEEALRQAVEIEIKGVSTRVFTREHLMAICLQVGRPKDIARLLQFMEQSGANLEQFANIIKRNTLSEAWERFQIRYLSEL